MDYFTLLTPIGEAKIANGILTGVQVNITKMAVGDGGGTPIDPQNIKNMTQLINQVWIGNVMDQSIHESEESWVVISANIPSTVGGFTIREFCLIDDAGDVIAIGNYPQTVKIAYTSGAGNDVIIRVILAVSSTEVVNLSVDPAIVMASRAYVDSLQLQHIYIDTATVTTTTAKTNTLHIINATTAVLNIALPPITQKALVVFYDRMGNFDAKKPIVTVATGQKIEMFINGAYVEDTQIALSGETKGYYALRAVKNSSNVLVWRKG